MYPRERDEDLKRSLAAQYRDDRDAYTEGKGELIEDMLRRARSG